MKTRLTLMMVLLFGAALGRAGAVELLREDFETPDVGTYSQGTRPAGWVGATTGFRAGYHGITDKASGDFSASDPNHQAYAFRYSSNAGITSGAGELDVLRAGVTYDVSFDVVRDDGRSDLNDLDYDVKLIAFTNAALRTDCTTTPDGSLVVATATGSAPANGTFQTVTFSVTGDAVTHAGYLGFDLGLRFRGSYETALIDNVVVSNDLDVTPPFITTLVPTNGAAAVALDTDLMAVFDEDILADSGSIIISNLTDATGLLLGPGDPQVSIAGSVLTVKPSLDLLPGRTYAVLIETNAIRDAWVSHFAGMTNTTTWRFDTAATDTITPKLQTVSPTAGSSAVAADANLVATFSEAVILVDGGVVTVTNLTAGTATTITLPDASQVATSGAVVTINLASDLVANAHYAVLFDGSAIDDVASNSFAGIADTATWNFSVAGPPVAQLNGGVTDVRSGAATLNGIVADGDTASATLCWGRVDGGTGGPGDWANRIEMGVVAESASFSATRNALLYGVEYVYRVYATNGLGEAWSPLAAFTTLPPTRGGGGTLTADVTLDFDAGDPASGVDGDNWNSLTTIHDYDWDFGADVTLESVISGGTVITQAYRFTGGTADDSNPDWSPLNEDADASWELWLKPDDTGTLAADQVIFESGGSGDGITIWYQPGSTGDDAGTMLFTIDNQSVQGTVSARVDTVDFRHIACVYDRDYAGTNDLLQIYVDGVLSDSAVVGGLDDWSGTDDGGLGNFFGTVAETAGAGPFDGDLAVFRFWDSKALSVAEVGENFRVLEVNPDVLTPGVDIDLNAGDDDGVNTLWEDARGNWDLTLDTGSGVTYVTNAGSAYPGITAAYAFPGGTNTAGNAAGGSFEALGWDQEPISLEIWFKPDSTTNDAANGGQILFETGGTTGLGIFYDDGTIDIAGDIDEVISGYDVSGLTNDFIQVVLTYDTSGGNNFGLYVNGVPVATGDRADTDWSGADSAALGGRGGANTGGRGDGAGNAGQETESFEGQIAIFRAYRNQVLTAAQVSANFNAVTATAKAVGITNDGAVNVAAVTADLRGTLDAPRSLFTVHAYYGTNSANTSMAAWLADTSASHVVLGTFTNVSGLAVTGTVSSLTQETTYHYAMMASNAVTTIWATPNATFTTLFPELVPPVIAALSPTNGQVGVIETNSLIATFDEGIYLVAGGVITLTNLTDGTATDLTLPDTQISALGSNLVVDPLLGLPIGDTVAVLIDGAAVRDVLGNVFPGLADPNTWQFTVSGLPTLAPGDIVDDQAGGPMVEDTQAVFTLTFSEDMDDTTVTAADFENAGTAAISIGAVSETAPGVFTVEVTPTTAGTLILQVLPGADLRDSTGNAMDTTAAISDDTTITVTVEGIPPTLVPSDIVDNVGGGPLFANEPLLYTVTFSEDMDASTVTSNDFNNAGDALISIGAVTETAPGVFTVEVLPRRIGALQLQVPAGASLLDTSGNALNTTSNILDNTTIAIEYGRVLFTEDFEVPATPTAYSQGTTPARWVRASAGYRASYHGITDKAGGDFIAADPNHQAYAFRYTNSGFTTDEGVLNAVLATGVTYTVVFHVVRDDGGNAGRPYTAQLIAFAPGAARNDCTGGPPAGSPVLASAGGNAPADGSFQRVAFNVTGNAVNHAGYLGYDLGLRFRGATTSAIIDSVAVYDDVLIIVPSGSVLIIR